MRKLILITILIILDITAYLYLGKILSNRKEYIYKEKENDILYQIDKLELNNIEDFDFDKYFFTTCNNYLYSFDDNQLIVTINTNKYYFDYKIIEPEVVEKIVYKEIETEKNTNKIEADDCDEMFYVDNDYLKFDINTDLDYIRNILINNLNTTKQVSIDYSRLNVSQIGQYSVIYNASDEKIEIIVEII